MFVPKANPFSRGVAKPAISPSEITSSIFAVAVLFKLSFTFCGVLPPPPFPPPAPEMIDDAKTVADWKEKYEVWAKENKHLPKIMPFDQIHQRVKQSYEARAKQGAEAPQAAQPAANVPASKNTGDVVVDNRLQILESKQNILEAKLDQILAAVQNKPNTPSQPVKSVPQPQPQKVEVDAQVKKQVKEMAAVKAKTNQKSRTNKKEIANF